MILRLGDWQSGRGGRCMAQFIDAAARSAARGNRGIQNREAPIGSGQPPGVLKTGRIDPHGGRQEETVRQKAFYDNNDTMDNKRDTD